MILIYLINFLLATTTTISMTIVPLLATGSIGMSMFWFGIIEGGTEFIAMILRFASGNLFDHIKNRRMLFVTPVVLSLFSKILLLFPSFATIFSSKISERMSNGLFASPRDAFVGEKAKNKGFALAILNCSKTLGCVVGPLIVSFFAWKFGALESNPENMYNVISIACFIGFIALIGSFFLNASHTKTELKTSIFSMKDVISSWKATSPILILSFLFFLGRFNDGMIMLYLKKTGFKPEFYLATISIFNTSMFIFSPLMGYVIDKGLAKYMLITTIIALIIFNILFYNIDLFPMTFGIIGLISWGIQRAGAQITFCSMIFKNSPTSLYGTSIGLFSIISGVGTLLCSMISGHLANTNFDEIFILSGFLSLATLLAAFFAIRKKYI